MNKLTHALGFVMIALVALLTTPVSLTAQETVNLFIEDIQASPGASISVNVQVENFDSIGGIQFSLEWNPAELNFVGVDNLALGASAEGNFNLSQTASGRIGYLNFDMTATGFSLENGATLFSLEFDAVGPDNSVFDLSFTDSPTGRVVADANAVAIEASYSDGSVTLGTPSGLANVLQNDPRFTVSPNPFSATTAIRISELGSGAATLTVFSATGVTILSRKLELLGREQFVNISAADLSAAGVYFIRLETNDGNYGRKLIFRGNGR